MATLLLWLLVATARGFSDGGRGPAPDGNDGTPLVQTCDAIALCTIPDPTTNGTRCPDGMVSVAPPRRSEVYSLATADGSTGYTPGKIVPLELSVTRKQIMGKRNRGEANSSLESSKYIGLLLYAVREGDAAELKVGSWEIPGEIPPRFWLPSDAGCGARAVMHASASPKAYVERFLFRAPPAGAGSLVFRALLKQGDTNAGAFYWPGTGADPAAGVAGGDLTLSEAGAPAVSAATSWIRAAAGETCADACVRSSLVCDEGSLAAATSQAALLEAVEHDQMCRLPLLEECNTSPSISTLIDGYCWYKPSQCPADSSAESLCSAPAPDSSVSMSVRLCACSQSGRRLLSTAGAGVRSVQASAAQHDDKPPPLNDTGDEGADDARLAAVKGCPMARRAAAIHASGGDGSTLQPCPNAKRRMHSDAQSQSSDRGALDTPLPSFMTVAAFVALGALLVLGALRRRLGRQGGGGHRALLGALALADSVSAHNWLNSPRSRTAKLSMQSPCPPRQRFNHPDIQVNRGQPFTVEWQVMQRLLRGYFNTMDRDSWLSFLRLPRGRARRWVTRARTTFSCSSMRMTRSEWPNTPRR